MFGSNQATMHTTMNSSASKSHFTSRILRNKK